MAEGDEEVSLAALTTEIVSAYVSHNQIGTAELAELIGGVAGQLGRIGSEPEQPAESVLAVPLRRSIQPDHLVCLVCGKPQKVLKRHLGAAHYGWQRRELALKIGLGRPRKPARRRRKNATGSTVASAVQR